MRNRLLLWLVGFSFFNLNAETTYYSNGLSSYTSGNNTYHSDGSSSYDLGNNTYYSDGSSSYIVK